MNGNSIPKSLSLKAGDMVEVRSKVEILSTLDKNGCLDGLPFMPEMLALCGRRTRVYKRAHKACDTIEWKGSRRVTNAVHLEGSRCDGQAHGGCQAECLIFWKEAWLKRVSTDPVAIKLTDGTVDDAGCSEEDVLASTCKSGTAKTDQPVYACQATQLLQASSPLPWTDWGQYWEDYTSGNFRLKWMLGVIFYATYNIMIRRSKRPIRNTLRWVYDTVQKLRGRPCYPRTPGRIPSGVRTPTISLNLQPGEMVRVKSFDEILDTIDTEYRNRGMKWDAELVPYCGGVYRVKKRVGKIIDEKTGKMLRLNSEPIILEGVICQSKYSDCRYFCPRSIYPYWHEIWLERIAPGSPSQPGEQSHASQTGGPRQSASPASDPKRAV
jgi:hypothetical protein